MLDEILKHAEENKSFTCLGPPRVGKTRTNVCLALTHCAAQLLPDRHAAHYFHARLEMRESFKGWILLDEISMIPLPVLAAFDQLRQNGTKICTFGDWGQLPPHPEANSWRGTHVLEKAFEKIDCTSFGLILPSSN